MAELKFHIWINEGGAQHYTMAQQSVARTERDLGAKRVKFSSTIDEATARRGVVFIYEASDDKLATFKARLQELREELDKVEIVEE